MFDQGSRFGFVSLVLSWEQRQKGGELTVTDPLINHLGAPLLVRGPSASLFYQLPTRAHLKPPAFSTREPLGG